MAAAIIIWCLSMGIYQKSLNPFRSLTSVVGLSRGSDSLDGINWSRFAYVQYATNRDYLCASVMFFERLHVLKSQPQRVLMYPKTMLDDPETTVAESDNARMLIKARDQYAVQLLPISILTKNGSECTLIKFQLTVISY